MSKRIGKRECSLSLPRKQPLSYLPYSNAPPLPKNEAERILEMLEGMGRTPLGEAGRAGSASARVSSCAFFFLLQRLTHIHSQKQIPVPLPSSLSQGFSRSASTPSLTTASPYGRRPTARTNASHAGERPGLSSQLRARDERRRLAIEREREEREKERLEDEEREAERAERRRRRKEEEEERLREEEEAMMLDDVEESEEEDPVPRRKTRSMVKSQSMAQVSTPAKKTRSSAPSSSKKTLAPAPSSTTKRSTRSTRSRREPTPPPVEEEDQEEDEPMSPPRTRSRRSPSKSPAPPSRKVKSPTPEPPTPAPVLSPSPPAVEQREAPKIVFPPSVTAAASSSAPAQRSSLRPGKSHSSRQHTASSKVFSAREEDLPPVDEAALGKISMGLSFPAGFTFGNGVGAEKKDEPKKDDGGLLGRLGAAPSTSTSAESGPASAPAPKAPAFSFTPASGSTTPQPPSTEAPKPAPFSFSSSSTSTAPAPSLPKSTSASSDFFSKPSASASSTSLFGASKEGEKEKPNFFASIVAEKGDSVPKAEVKAPSFSFKPAPVAAEKKDEPSPAPAAAAANPFAAFGKPVSEILKESGAGKEEEKKAPSFGGFGASTSTAPAAGGIFSFGLKKDEEVSSGVRWTRASKN